MWISRDRNHFQVVIYLLLSSLHCSNGVHSLYLLKSNKVPIAFFCFLHYYIVVWYLLNQLKSFIKLKVVTVSVADCWRQLPWWLHILLMKEIPLDMWHQFMGCNSEVVKFPSNVRCYIKQASFVRCIDTSFPRRDVVIWLADTNYHT